MAWGADARYTRLVEQHGSTLLHLALLLTGNRSDAEDAVQDALIAVAARWAIAPPASGLAYLRKAVANRAIEIMRARREHPIAEVPDRAIDDLGFLAIEQDRRFFAIVDALPEGQRATVVLRYHADLDDRQIARILGITPETVRSQAHRALAKLREHANLLEGRDA
jgi:RNA polymerase sigma factor (sigma-70 family)